LFRDENSPTSKDSIISILEIAVEQAIRINHLVEYIPEIGMNIVYANPEPSSVCDVAGLSGRIIKALDKPMSCGEIVYGGSRYLASVVLEAMKLDSTKRSAINIRGGDDIPDRLKAIGCNVHILASKIKGVGCPVALYLKSSNSLVDAYLHPGDFGIEPTTTIIGDNPLLLVKLLEKLVQHE
jgi:hydroxymethylpyrimidine/phosphomethylpyrimidine kinase